MTRKDKMKLIRDIGNKLEENGRYYNVELTADGTIAIDISWGDWKHDHAFLNVLIRNNFNLNLVDEVVNEEDGSDCYSSTHYFSK